MTFRTKSGAVWCLDESQVKHWRTVYQGLDVWHELEKAALWVEAHDARRKTARGMPRFLIGWLNRAEKDGKKAAPVVNARDKQGEPWHYQHCSHTPKCGDFRACCELKQGLFS